MPPSTTPKNTRKICEKCQKEIIAITTGEDGKTVSACCKAPFIEFGDEVKINPRTCEHHEFQASVRCKRDVAEAGISFSAEITLMCKHCKSPMSFIGATIGAGLPDKPHMDQLGLTMVLPFRTGIDLLEAFLQERKPMDGDGSCAGGKPEA